MIVSEGIYVFRCTGCTAYLEMSEAQVRDPFERFGAEERMKMLHAECDGFGNVALAKSALKRKRRGMRNLILKPHVDRALEQLASAERSIR